MSNLAKTERTGKELLIASKSFADEHRLQSWWYLWSTLALFALLVAVAGSSYAPLLASVSASILAGFVVVRLFVIFHDFFHGAILRKSKIAHSILYMFGLMVLSPAKSWKSSHDHHHKHNSNEFGAEIGGFPLMTTDEYHKASPLRQLGYRLVRNPLVILLSLIHI